MVGGVISRCLSFTLILADKELRRYLVSMDTYPDLKILTYRRSGDGAWRGSHTIS
jgi:hypothetical protein